MKGRTASIARNTSETNVSVTLNLDGTGQGNIQTGVQFMDHMLNLFSKHGLFDLDVSCKGDLDVDAHHSIEDVGICLGLTEKAHRQERDCALCPRLFPMDETLSVSRWTSGRPILYTMSKWKGTCRGAGIDLIEEFWKAVVTHARLNLPSNCCTGATPTTFSKLCSRLLLVL
jgi:imidazoleglycerol-phosphate dehydratase